MQSLSFIIQSQHIVAREAIQIVGQPVKLLNDINDIVVPMEEVKHKLPGCLPVFSPASSDFQVQNILVEDVHLISNLPNPLQRIQGHLNPPPHVDSQDVDVAIIKRAASHVIQFEHRHPFTHVYQSVIGARRGHILAGGDTYWPAGDTDREPTPREEASLQLPTELPKLSDLRRPAEENSHEPAPRGQQAPEEGHRAN